ncbi:MAG: metalloregulator ArsR/SmtB family transcription factor [Candidatus Nanoarchaeia archaeon]|nr:metalloregulator ArsR/SmtB family transcription factor [Candidatus Nanoarchaeia archaeon]MDD5357767.1 metalloregulator ArsR/SmtB family transcription factor [Candidatus Nanoarchaeia archaeon]MDD5588686.1 metalloregulator ArsR/SmtB family transcription factor [Candidatus Nanoarchaeia archaeon]
MNKKPCKESYNIFFTNLANPLKIGIILSLRENRKNVTELTRELGVEQSKISHALKCLKECKIVEAKADGKSRVYSLNRETILPMLELIDKHASVHCKNKCCFNSEK